MYSVLKSKKIVVQNQQEEQIHFCCFISNEIILLIFQNNQVSLVDISSNHLVRPFYRSDLPTNDIITDCKRISVNNCAIITKQKDRLIFLRVHSQESIEIQSIAIEAQIFMKSITSFTQIIPFSNVQFAILEHNFDNKSINTLILTSKQRHGIDFSTKAIFTEMQWCNSNFQTIRPLQRSRQFAIFKQREIAQVSWRVRFLSICSQYQEKIIDLHDFLTDEHTLTEVIVKDVNQYYLFAKRRVQITNEEVLQVWRSRLHSNHGNFMQSCELMTNYGFSNLNFVQVVAINYEMGIFLAKNYSHEEVEGQIYNNTLELVGLDSGITLQVLNCNLKSLDISPNKQIILDYSQQINNLDNIAVHLRKLLPKKILYHSLMQNSTVLKKEGFDLSFEAQVLELL